MKFLFVITDSQYTWLRKHAKEIGESMSTVVRRAISEYRKKIE